MKRLLFFLSLCFICTAAVTEQISINWGVDNQLYTTTTCEIGDNVILPSTPTKRGYTFRGWKKDSFNRGTWPNWSDVPQVANAYQIDIYDNHTPKLNDYIIVSDTSSYPVNAIIIDKPAASSAYNAPIKCTVNGVETTVVYARETVAYICDGLIKVSCFSSNYFSFYANADLYYEGVLFHQGDFILEQHWMRSLKFAVSLTKINGAWRFIYTGLWDKDGRLGWKNVDTIVNE